LHSQVKIAKISDCQIKAYTYVCLEKFTQEDKISVKIVYEKQMRGYKIKSKSLLLLALLLCFLNYSVSAMKRKSTKDTNEFSPPNKKRKINKRNILKDLINATEKDNYKKIYINQKHN